MDSKIDNQDVRLGLDINEALVQKDGEELIVAVTHYMKEFNLSASSSCIANVPVDEKMPAKIVALDLSRFDSASGSRLARFSFEFDGRYSSYC